MPSFSDRSVGGADAGGVHKVERTPSSTARFRPVTGVPLGRDTIARPAAEGIEQAGFPTLGRPNDRTPSTFHRKQLRLAASAPVPPTPCAPSSRAATYRSTSRGRSSSNPPRPPARQLVKVVGQASMRRCNPLQSGHRLLGARAAGRDQFTDHAFARVRSSGTFRKPAAELGQDRPRAPAARPAPATRSTTINPPWPCNRSLSRR